ncbi:MAG: efflux RND transporter periplasmic adaptor subunit [Verrucomicrobiae bacterium]|nr:efflux RND transporter periplasmic adaptor subunit [Verrucomicrobiae bacterium]
MANPKKRRKIIVFTVIGLMLAGLTLMAVFRKREVVITVQAEKVARRNLTEIVVANGRIQPVLQVKISPEVSGEIIALPVKEGQPVQKGDLILKIKPDFYTANRNQAQAAYNSSLASQAVAQANLERAEAELKRHEEMFRNRLISESVFTEARTTCEVARAQATSAKHQVEMSSASLARAEEELAKTTIVSPLTGTISKLNSQVGERVVGTATMAGTEVMIIADLNEMEARVDIGESDVVLIAPGQKARLEVDAFKDRKFTGLVTEIANSSKGAGYGGGQSQEATKFEVKIRINEKEPFRPGMSVSTEIETRYRTNVLTVPFASVTARLPKEKAKPKPDATSQDTNSAAGNGPTDTASTNTARADKKSKESPQTVEVVFVMDGDHAKMVPVKIGISDDSYWEITDGLTEGQEVVSGGYKAISRELEDGKRIRKGTPEKDDRKQKQ